MQVTNSATTPTALATAHGELIYELVGRAIDNTTDAFSVAQVVIPPGKASLRHYHPRALESYYVVKGTACMEIDDDASSLSPGDTVFIPAPAHHKIFNRGQEPLVLVVVCVPAWEPSNTVWLEPVEN